MGTILSTARSWLDSMMATSQNAAIAAGEEVPESPGPEVGINSESEALRPASSERPFDGARFQECSRARMRLRISSDNSTLIADILTSHTSKRKWMLGRTLETAIGGEVWHAQEVDIADRILIEKHVQYVVKRMPWEGINGQNGGGGECRLREISALAILSNPGHRAILPLEEAISDGENLYLVSPFVRDGDMCKWMSNVGLVEEDELKPLIRDVLEGLVYQHSKGICHGDLSMENILVDPNRARAYIIDYGRALRMPVDESGRRRLSIGDERQGKSYCCAPEAYKGKDYDGVKVDVFMLGATCFTVLCCDHAYAEASRSDKRFKQLVWHGDVEGAVARTPRGAVSREAADFIRQAMSYYARDRPMPQDLLAHPWLS